MNIFLSWSGNTSHKLAIAFRNWLPSVIQQIKPYVSSEDIDKGARWATDISDELNKSSFGILFVTNENINAPWLNFEAGALSKTLEKTCVSPFLFHIKPSDLNEALLQFQATNYQKDDIKKLLCTINKASGEELITQEMLDKSFDMWFPKLENELAELEKISSKIENKRTVISKEDILEEILELSRKTHKIILSSKSNEEKNIVNIIDNYFSDINRINSSTFHHKNTQKKRSLLMVEELIENSSIPRGSISFVQFSLGLIREYIPFIYDIGNELIYILLSNRTKKEKENAITEFERIIELSNQFPFKDEIYGAEDIHIPHFVSNLPKYFQEVFNNYL